MDEIENWFHARKEVVLWDIYQDTVDKWEKTSGIYSEVITYGGIIFEHGVFPFVHAKEEGKEWINKRNFS